MPNAATDVIGHAAQLKLRKAKQATPSQLSLVSFRAWDIFIKDTSLRGFYGCSGRSRWGFLCYWQLSHLPAGALVSFSLPHRSNASCVRSGRSRANKRRRGRRVLIMRHIVELLNRESSHESQFSNYGRLKIISR